MKRITTQMKKYSMIMMIKVLLSILKIILEMKNGFIIIVLVD